MKNKKNASPTHLSTPRHENHVSAPHLKACIFTPPLGGKVRITKFPFGFFRAQNGSELLTIFSHDTHFISIGLHIYTGWQNLSPKNPVWIFSMPKLIPECSPLFLMVHILFFIGLHINPGWQSLDPKIPFGIFSCRNQFRNVRHFFP